MASAGWRLPVRSGTLVSPSITAPMAEASADDRGLVHGDLDPLALAGALALDERPQDAGAEMDAGEEVADRGAGLGRRPVGVAGRVGDAAHRLDGDVHGGEIAIGPVEPEARAAAIDQARD